MGEVTAERGGRRRRSGMDTGEEEEAWLCREGAKSCPGSVGQGQELGSHPGI